MLKQYLTIKEEAEAEISVKKSRFIADVFFMDEEKDFSKKLERS